MKRAFLFLMVLSLSGSVVAYAKIYKYTNEKGMVSYTDQLSKVPQVFRSNAEVVDHTDRRLVQAQPGPLSSPPPPSPLNPVSSEVGHPFPTIMVLVVSTVLAGVMLFMAKGRVTGTLVRLAITSLFIVLLGDTLSTLFITREHHPLPFVSSLFDQLTKPLLAGVSPIKNAETTAKEFENKLEEQKKILDAISQTEDQHD